MHVTLINPPQLVALSNYLTTIVFPPLGLGYLAAYIRQRGVRVEIVDALIAGAERLQRYHRYHLRGIPFEQIVEMVPAETNVVGIGCMFSTQWPVVRELVRVLRDRRPCLPIILGGEHITGLPELCLSTSAADFCALGEGEEVLMEVVRHLGQGSPALEGIGGLAFRDRDGRIQVGPPRQRIRDLDRLPWPAWDLVDVARYIDYNQPHGAARGRSMPILATRGCPYRCTFCSSPSMWRTRWYARDPKRVVDEMEEYVRLYRANDFQFEDLTAIVRKDWVIAFCTEIIQRGLRISWQLPSGTRSEAIDGECAALMKQSGCHHFAYAPESGSEETLRIIRKQVNLADLIRSGRQALRAGVQVQCFFIMGFPHERARHFWDTFRLLIRCAWIGVSEVHISAFAPYPNSEAFRQLQAAGKIGELTDDYFFGLYGQDDLIQRRSMNDHVGDRTLALLILLGYAAFFGTSFLIRPQRLLIGLFGGRASGGKLAKLIKGTIRNMRYMLASRG